MRNSILRIIVTIGVFSFAPAGCSEPVNPSLIVKKKCDKLQKLADEDQDLDEGSQPLARESMEELCEQAALDCKNEPRGADCKKAVERLNMVP